jgi:DNA-binding transcriptional ArsR family regulator
MNRIMGRYNAVAARRDGGLGLTTPKMRALAVLSVIEGPLIRELAVYTVVEQSTLSRALDQLDADGLIRREPDANDSRATRSSSPMPGAPLRIALAADGRCAVPHVPRHPRCRTRAFVGTLQKILTNIRKHDI